MTISRVTKYRLRKSKLHSSDLFALLFVATKENETQINNNDNK